MPQLTKQFAIIEKLKSLVKKSTRPFRRRGENMAISEDIARKIQKNSYDQSHAKVKDAVTPPYKSIAEQLQVEDEQIFRGAIFNLANIALTTEKYAREIQNSGVNLICAFDKDFPPLLLSCRLNEKPFLFAYKGDISLLNGRAKNFAVVGSLTPSKDILRRENASVAKLSAIS